MNTPELNAEDELRQMIDKVAYLAIGVHLLLIGLYYVWGYENLSLLNLACTMAWFHGRHLNKQGKIDLAINFLSAEIVVHAIATVSVLGWESGFQLYLLSALVFHLLYAGKNIKRMIMSTSLFAFVFLALQLFCKDGGQYGADSWLMQGIYYVNFSASMLGISLCVYYYNEVTAKAHRKLYALASTDALTGLPSRRAFDTQMQKRLMEAEQASLIMADIDYFKRINDTYGHDVGDKVLQEVACRFQQKLRQNDVVFRWGGEEFLITLPHTSLGDAHVVAKSLCEVISHSPIVCEDAILNVSITCGVSTTDQSINGVGQLIKHADQALYRGKENGRNRVTLFGEMLRTDSYSIAMQ